MHGVTRLVKGARYSLFVVDATNALTSNSSESDTESSKAGSGAKASASDSKETVVEVQRELFDAVLKAQEAQKTLEKARAELRGLKRPRPK
jgi:hypothetical protein